MVGVDPTGRRVKVVAHALRVPLGGRFGINVEFFGATPFLVVHVQPDAIIGSFNRKQRSTIVRGYLRTALLTDPSPEPWSAAASARGLGGIRVEWIWSGKESRPAFKLGPAVTAFATNGRRRSLRCREFILRMSPSQEVALRIMPEKPVPALEIKSLCPTVMLSFAPSGWNSFHFFFRALPPVKPPKVTVVGRRPRRPNHAT